MNKKILIVGGILVLVLVAGLAWYAMQPSMELTPGAPPVPVIRPTSDGSVVSRAVVGEGVTSATLRRARSTSAERAANVNTQTKAGG